MEILSLLAYNFGEVADISRLFQNGHTFCHPPSVPVYYSAGDPGSGVGVYDFSLITLLDYFVFVTGEIEGARRRNQLPYYNYTYRGSEESGAKYFASIRLVMVVFWY